MKASGADEVTYRELAGSHSPSVMGFISSSRKSEGKIYQIKLAVSQFQIHIIDLNKIDISIITMRK